MLPRDFPSWKLVYYYFAIWSKADETGVSLLDRLLGYDAGKKVSGIKLHIAADTLGL